MNDGADDRRIWQALEAAGLFDPELYLAHNPDVATAGVDPLEHYFCVGGMEGRSSSRRFNNFIYNERAPASADEHPHPLLRCFDRYAHGSVDGEDGFEQFAQAIDVCFVSDVFQLNRRVVAHIEDSQLFDTAFYLDANHDVGALDIPPLAHFLLDGEREGRAPRRGYLRADARRTIAEAGVDIDANQSLLVQLAMVELDHDAQRTRTRPKIQPTPASETIALTASGLVTTWCEGAFNVSNEFQHDDATFREVPTAPEDALVIGFSADGDELDSISVPIESDEVVTLRAELAKSPVGPTIAATQGVTALVFRRRVKRGMRYYLRLHAATSGARLPVRAFDAAANYPSTRTGSMASSWGFPSTRDGLERQLVVLRRRSLTIRQSRHIRDIAATLGVDSILSIDPDLDTGALVEHLIRSRYVAFVETAGKLQHGFDLSALLDACKKHGSTVFYVDTRANDDFAVDRTIDEYHNAHYLALETRGQPREVVWVDNANGRQSSTPVIVDRGIEADPHVVIATILYQKIDHLDDFLRAIERQDYRGLITVAIVDDGSPDDVFLRATEICAASQARHPALGIRLLRNASNEGNCASRNRAIREVDGDIYSIVDCDCLLSRGFVRSHVQSHLAYGATAVIGPLNLETHGAPAWQMLEDLEVNPTAVADAMALQDDVQPDAFVNTITRNLSLTADWLHSQPAPFDLAFSYRDSPDTGFGWEDVDLGARLFAERASIHFDPRAISLHQSHPPSVDPTRQIQGSARNLDALFNKHPDLEFVARRWGVQTVARLGEWASVNDVATDALARCKQRFVRVNEDHADYLHPNRHSRRLRIALYRWHGPHQYEIFKLPHDFTLFTHTGTAFTNHWPSDQRPLRDNVRVLPATDFDPRDYDVAIVHFDENVLAPDLANGALPFDWGASFEWLMAHPLPKIAICHGTPPFVGQYGQHERPIDTFEIIADERDRLVARLADAHVVCNSYQAQAEWGFVRSSVIWHGLDPQEFPPGVPTRDVLSHGADNDRPYYRGRDEFLRVVAGLDPDLSIATHRHAPPKGVSVHDPNYAKYSFRAWVDHLADHRFYLNTTRRSPMPRSRTEAMFVGAIPVSLRNHDVDRFITPGIDGFYSDSPDELADFINAVVRDDSALRRLRRAARQTALDRFNHLRFLNDWTRLLATI